MAKNIKGITIEIGGNTTKLEEALKGVNKIVYSTNSELRNLNQALKLDPKNTELLAQKQDVLKKNIAATTERLQTLKEAQRQMGDYNSLTEEQKEQYRALSVEIAKGENALKGMKKELLAANGINLDKLKEGLKKVGEVAVDVAKKMAKVTAAIGGALAGLVTAGVKSYANLQQNIGGIETLFGTGGKSVEEYAKSVGKSVSSVQKEYDALEKAQKLALDNASKGYQSAGLSANQYMETITSFAASLKQSMKNADPSDIVKAADQAVIDMSDNANKMGTDMQSIQNAYQGFAKQNYTMLDNLKLGYGGTKTEMQRLLKDAEKFSGVKYDINNLNDVYSAIHVIQEEMGIAGTTADEAEKTISGSVNAMKGAFDNFLNGSGSPEQLANSLTVVFKNVSEAIMNLAPSILSGIVTLIQTLLPQIAQLLLTMIPQLLTAITNMINSLLAMVTSNMDAIAAAVTKIVTAIITFFTQNLPTIIDLGLKLLIALAQGIADAIPELVPQIVECITTIINVIVENLPLIITTGIEVLIALIEGIIQALPQLANQIPQIIETIVSTLIANLPMLLKAALQLILALAKGLIVYIPTLLTYIPKIIVAIVKGIIEGVPQMIKAAGDLIKGLVSGMKQKAADVKNAAKEIINKIKETFTKIPEQAKKWGKDMIDGLKQGIKDKIASVGNAVKGVADKIKSLLHFSRPDEGPLREYEKWMPDFMEGLAKGIDRYSYLVVDATENLSREMTSALGIPSLVGDVNSAMSGLNAGIQSSVNPIINPNVTVESNYRLMATAMKDALQDMDVVMDDKQMGRFVVKTVTDTIYS